jgi:hypothetical protein
LRTKIALSRCGGFNQPKSGKALKSNVLLVAVMSALVPLAASAQSESVVDRAQFFVSQRVWFADWDIGAIDSRIIPPTATQPTPVMQTFPGHVRDRRAMPLTGFGVSLDRWTLSATVGWSTEFSDDRIAGGKVSRSEYDINLGYAVTPNISTVLIYKGGKTEIPAMAGSAAAQLPRDRSRLRGLGLGVSGRYPMAENWNVYGSAAFGPGRSTFSNGDRYNIRYSVAEVGVGYRIPGFFANMSITAGYRYQNLDFRRGPAYSFALTPEPVLIARDTQRIESATKGFTAGVAFSF